MAVHHLPFSVTMIAPASSSGSEYVWTALKALDDVAIGTMSMVTIQKTRRCFRFGELIADRIAKGEV